MRRGIIFSAVILTAFVFTVSSVAAQGVTNKNGISFLSWKLPLGEGKTSTVQKKVLGNTQSHTYSFNAKKGQTLWVQLVSKNDTITFAVRGVNNQEIGTAGDEDWSWTGELPESGEYTIVVYSNEGTKGSYTLNAKFK